MKPTLSDTAMSTRPMRGHPTGGEVDDTPRQQHLRGKRNSMHDMDWSAHRAAHGSTKSRLSGQPELEMLSASLQAYDTIATNRISRVDGGKFYLSGQDQQYWKDAQRRWCFWAFFTAMLGMVLGVVGNEIRWNGQVEHWDPKSASEAVKVGNVVCTMVTIVFLYRYYESLIFLKRLSGVYLEAGVTVRSLKGAGLWSLALFDVALMLPQPLPGLDFEFSIYNKGLGRTSVHSIDSILLALMVVRLMYLPRFYGECLSDLSSDAAAAFGRFNHIRLDADFILKYVIANSLYMVTVLAVILVTAFAYLMMVFERPIEHSSLQHYANCVWLIVITMTTVGYGDTFPTTLLGRMVAVFASITAVIMLAVTVNLVVSKLTLSRAESKVLEVIETISQHREVKESAALVITRWARAYLSYMHSDQHVRPGGYLLIPETRSARKRNMDLRAGVYSSLDLLVAIERFTEVNNCSWQDSVPSDLPEMIAHVSSMIEAQESRMGRIEQQCQHANDLVAQLLAAHARKL